MSFNMTISTYIALNAMINSTLFMYELIASTNETNKNIRLHIKNDV